LSSKKKVLFNVKHIGQRINNVKDQL